MGEVETAPRRKPLIRRVIGWVGVALAVLIFALFVLGTWNPGDLVVLWRFAGNPLLGAIIVSGLALAVTWLLAPVESEAMQIGRTRVRITFALVLLFSVLGYGLFGNRFSPDYRIVGRSADGERTAVVYEPGTDFQRLHIWVGKGLGTRYAGTAGKPCGPTTVTFEGTDLVRVATSYGTSEIRLDPRTGRPLSRLGPRCSG
jgi:hypothetical protein